MRRALAAAILSLALPATGLTDPAPAAPAAPAPATAAPVRGNPGNPGDTDCARARKAGRTCELTIEPEAVGGSRPDPDDIALRGRRFEPTGSLLRLRRDFIAEIVKAADDL
jgi:hypothetical protein